MDPTSPDASGPLVRLLARPWGRVALACTALAVISLLTNLSFPAEMEGHWQVYSFLRKSLSRFANSRTLWAGAALYAGWQMRGLFPAALAGVLAAEGTLLIHYLLGTLIGFFSVAEAASNQIWFTAGLVLCAPLGCIGHLASRPGWVGLLCRLVLPLGALLEPWVLRMFDPYPQLPWAVRCSSITCGVMLTILGAVTMVLVLVRGPRGFRLPGDARTTGAARA